MDARQTSKSYKRIQYRPPQRPQTYSVDLRRKSPSLSHSSRRRPVLARRKRLMRLHDGHLVGFVFKSAVHPTNATITTSDATIHFFFQAEDGIRAIGVTGVQTCALPISRASPSQRPRKLKRA